jgi:lariat debranching enzyme
VPLAGGANPDEIAIELDEDEEEKAPAPAAAVNPDEINIDMDDDESAPAPSAQPATSHSTATAVTSPASAVPPTNPHEIALDLDEENRPAAGAPARPVAPAPLNPDEIMLDEEAADVAPTPVPLPPRNDDTESADDRQKEKPKFAETRFLALDKCLPRREYLEVRSLAEFVSLF